MTNFEVLFYQFNRSKLYAGSNILSSAKTIKSFNLSSVCAEHRSSNISG